MNNNLRDIIIFPKFKNIEEIEKIRKDNDKLFNVIKPHITLVFPFQDKISNELLLDKIKVILKEFNKFKIVFKGVSLSNDNYIYLNCVEGKDNLIKIHDDIYTKILPNHLRKDIDYIPHITLGQATNIDFLNQFNKSFETIIDEICIEEIGKNEETIIIDKIKL